MSTSAAHVVFGAGAVGRALAVELMERGEKVNLVSRTDRGLAPSGARVVIGDVRDTDFARWAGHGAAVLYQVLNPGYHRWSSDFPALQAAVLAAARDSGARLVSLENTYMYGPSEGRPFTEDHPDDARTRKGMVRAWLSRDLLAAHRAGQVEVAIGRASDYFGPGGGAQSPLGDRVMPAALAGGTARVLGDPDRLHTYSYIPDIAHGLIVLGEHPAAAGRVWHLPNDPTTRTTRAIVQTLYGFAGHAEARLRSIPTVLLRLLSLADRDVWEVLEMLYQFEQPFVVDSTLIARELGLHATPLDEALAVTLDSYGATAAAASR